MFLNDSIQILSLIKLLHRSQNYIGIFFFFVIDVFAWHQYLANKKILISQHYWKQWKGKEGPVIFFAYFCASLVLRSYKTLARWQIGMLLLDMTLIDADVMKISMSTLVSNKFSFLQDGGTYPRITPRHFNFWKNILSFS